MRYHARAYGSNPSLVASRLKVMKSLKDEGMFASLLDAKDFIEGRVFETDSLDVIRAIQKWVGEENMWVDIHDHEQMKLDDEQRRKDDKFLNEARKWYDGLSKLEKEYFERLIPGPPGA